MVKKRLFIISLFLLAQSASFFGSSQVFAQRLIAHRDSLKNGYNFWIYLPENYDSVNGTTPTVLFLHGASLCGNNLSRVRRYGPLHALQMGRRIDAVIIAPQNPGGAWNPDKIWNIVDWVSGHYPTDTNRFYVIGMSLGGYGTIDFASKYYNKIAAAMALCGGGNSPSYCGLNEIPLWIMHGTADRDVPLSQSQKIVSQMKACGDTSLLIFDKMKGVTHGGLAKVLYLPETYEWLFSHSRADSARSVNRNIVITTSTMRSAYKNLDRSGNKFTIVDNKSTNSMKVGIDEETGSGIEKCHIVRSGDTLSKIARRNHTTVSKLCRINGIKENSILRLGQKIYISK